MGGTGPWRALILGAGGARGAYEAGVLQALARAGLCSFDLVIGSSVGAANGAAVVLGLAPDLPELWLEAVRGLRLFRPERILGLETPFAIREAARALVARYGDMDRIRRSPAELVFTATDFDTGEPVLFSSRDGVEDDEERLQRFIAATTIPYVTGAPVRIRGRRYCDGAFAGNIPLEWALVRGFAPGEVLVIDPGPHAPGRWVARVFGFALERLDLLPLREARLLAGLYRSYLAAPAPERRGARVVRPSRPLGAAVLDFRPGTIERALAVGRADGEALLAGLGAAAAAAAART